uniref:DUF6532 domain-containing protein n=1 Tax=Mycena chlorophos TaxID=658473 RepID=A0ABQ0LM15_MYCCL|nr:predicted protein [Mycena chlorophos]
MTTGTGKGVGIVADHTPLVSSLHRPHTCLRPYIRWVLASTTNQAPPHLDLSTGRPARKSKPSEKQAENDRRRQEKDDAENNNLRKALEAEKRKRRKAEAELQTKYAERAPPESEEEDDQPISLFTNSFTSTTVSTGPKPKPKLKKVSGKDTAIALPTPARVPLQNVNNNARGRTGRESPQMDMDDSGPLSFNDTQQPMDSDDEMNDDPLANESEPEDDQREGRKRRRSASRSSHSGGRSPSPIRPRGGSSSLVRRSPQPLVHSSSPVRSSVPPRRPRKQARTVIPPEPVVVLVKVTFVGGQPPRGGRTAVRDLSSQFQGHIKKCRYLFEVYIWTKRAFPSIDEADKWVVEIWLMICEERGEMLELTERLKSMITDYGSHARNTVVKIVEPLVDGVYGLPATPPTELEKKCKNLLKDDAFAHQDTEARTNYPYHSIIKTAIQKVFFGDKKGRGVVFSKYFSPIPVPTLALLLAVIEYVINRYSTGKYDPEDTFDEANNSARYLSHLKRLQDWDSMVPEATLEYRQQMHDDCRQDARAPAIPVPITGLSDARRAQALREIQEMQRRMAEERVARAAAMNA